MAVASVGLVVVATVQMPKMMQTLESFQAKPSGATKFVIEVGKIIQNYSFVVAFPVGGLCVLLL